MAVKGSVSSGPKQLHTLQVMVYKFSSSKRDKLTGVAGGQKGQGLIGMSSGKPSDHEVVNVATSMRGLSSLVLMNGSLPDQLSSLA